MNQIILFRFHSHYDVCKERVRIIKHFNPNIPIYALFGGDKSDWEVVKKYFRDSPLEEIQISTNEDRYWKWLHPEHTLREWYQLHGHKLKFDLLFDEEWDILPVAPFSKIYKKKPGLKSIALTGVENLEVVKDRWRWVMGESHRANFIRFQEYIKESFRIDKISYASLGPGQIFTHQFLEDFASLSLDMTFVDPIVSEIIYPVVAQILNYSVIDTGLYPGWQKRDEALKFFNCWYVPIKKGVIAQELKKKDGRRIFHPVKYQFPLEDII